MNLLTGDIGKSEPRNRPTSAADRCRRVLQERNTEDEVIVYELGCAGGHRFEGWFGSAADFERQRDDKLLTCPVCNSDAIEVS